MDKYFKRRIISMVYILFICILFSSCSSISELKTRIEGNDLAASTIQMDGLNREENVKGNNSVSSIPTETPAQTKSSTTDVKDNSSKNGKFGKPTVVTVPNEVRPVTAKETSVKPNADAGVTVTDSNSIDEAIIYAIDKSNDVTLNVQGTININDMVNKVIKCTEKYGYAGYISGIHYSSDGNSFYVHFDYKGSKEQFISNINSVKAKVKSIVSTIVKPGMSEFDKELVIHDYLVNNVAYDTKNNPPVDDSYTSYGALIKGVAVCEGYAEAAYRLLNAAGVQNYIIDGNVGAVLHAWNIVKINNNYYQLDVTFDDPTDTSGANINYLSYNYFNLTDAQMSLDHSWVSADYPICASTTSNYYIYKGLVVNNIEEFYKVIQDGFHNKLPVIRCKIINYDAKVYNYDTYFKVIADEKIDYLDNPTNVSYYYYSTSNVFEFYVKYK